MRSQDVTVTSYRRCHKIETIKRLQVILPKLQVTFCSLLFVYVAFCVQALNHLHRNNLIRHNRIRSRHKFKSRIDVKFTYSRNSSECRRSPSLGLVIIGLWPHFTWPWHSHDHVSAFSLRRQKPLASEGYIFLNVFQSIRSDCIMAEFF